MCDIETATNFLVELLTSYSNRNPDVPSLTFSLYGISQVFKNNLKCPLHEPLFRQILKEFNDETINNNIKRPIIIINDIKGHEEIFLSQLVKEFLLWPKSISEFFYLRPDEKEYYPLHGQILDKCPEYYARDIETGRCLLTDKLPVGSFLRYKDEIIAGSGKELLLYLFSKEGSWENVTNIFKKPIEKPIEKQIIDSSKYNSLSIPIFSNVTTWNGISYFMKNWPKGFIFIPDFMTNNEQKNLFDKIQKLSWDQPEVLPYTKKLDRDIIQYGYIFDFNIKTPNIVKLTKVNNPPEFISCIINVIKKYSNQMGINKEFNPDQIIITKLKPGEGTLPKNIHPLYDTLSVRLSLGSIILFNLINKQKETLSIPLQPGSLLIMDNETQNYKQEIPKTSKDVYTMPFIIPETVSWDRTEYISIEFNTIKPEARGEDKTRK